MDWMYIALIAGGVVACRGATRVMVRSFAAAAIAAGVIIVALILWIAPVSVTGVG